MNEKKNAAREAVLAKLCQKTVVTGNFSLFGEHQVMHAACLMAEDSLQVVIKAATDQDEWYAEYHDPIRAVEVAMDIVRSLRVVEAYAVDDHTQQWWRAASVPCLAMEELLDKETFIWRHISSAVSEFVVQQNFLSLVSKLSVQEGGAA